MNLPRLALYPARPEDSWLSERGVWKGARREGGARSAIVSCPDCGFVVALSDHSVDETGNVSPSLVCANPGCEFHRHIMLLDWSD